MTEISVDNQTVCISSMKITTVLFNLDKYSHWHGHDMVTDYTNSRYVHWRIWLSSLHALQVHPMKDLTVFTACTPGTSNEGSECVHYMHSRYIQWRIWLSSLHALQVCPMEDLNVFTACNTGTSIEGSDCLHYTHTRYTQCRI